MQRHPLGFRHWRDVLLDQPLHSLKQQQRPRKYEAVVGDLCYCLLFICLRMILPGLPPPAEAGFEMREAGSHPRIKSGHAYRDHALRVAAASAIDTARLSSRLAIGSISLRSSTGNGVSGNALSLATATICES